MSTLKAFMLRVGVQGEDATIFEEMPLVASLIYENGHAVEEVSATLEPPLLGGEALVERGVATFKLKITVLSSLCRSHRFRVRVAAPGSGLSVVTSPMRTITKLFRKAVGKTSEEGSLQCTIPLIGLKRGVDCFGLGELDSGCEIEDGSLDALYEKMRENSELLKKLKQQQLQLSTQLMELRNLQHI